MLALAETNPLANNKLHKASHRSRRAKGRRFKFGGAR
jgi:hypothetical protein